MTSIDRQSNPPLLLLQGFVEAVRRALVEFLWLPLLIIAGFLLLAAGTSILDLTAPAALAPLRDVIRERLFDTAQATGNLLATIAGSVITVTSITFSLLLLAVQQAAATLSAQVYDQFLRRRVNHVYFGSFVGLAVFTLVTLATVNQDFNPVFGATVALLLTMVALVMLVLLLYTTINQMRPVVVIGTIHDRVLAARRRQHDLLTRTRRLAQSKARTPATPVASSSHGYIVRIDIDAIAQALSRARGEAEVVLRGSIGSFVAFADVLATVHTESAHDIDAIVDAVRSAIHLEQQRDLDTDPGYGIDELAIIGWTSVSTAKSDPAPGILVLHYLRNLLASWSADPSETAAEAARSDGRTVPVVYADDLWPTLFNAFETMAVVASESMQPQTAAELFRTLAVMFDRLPADRQPRAEDLIRRSLSALGEHVLTSELDEALDDLLGTLTAARRIDTAADVRLARQTLAATVGKLGSRSTRASTKS